MQYWGYFTIAFIFSFLLLLVLFLFPIMIMMDCYASTLNKKTKLGWIIAMILFTPLSYLYGFVYSNHQIYVKISKIAIIIFVILGTLIYLLPGINLKPIMFLPEK